MGRRTYLRNFSKHADQSAAMIMCVQDVQINHASSLQEIHELIIDCYLNG